MKDRLERIELRLQTLIEESLPALIPLGNTRQTLAHYLVDAIQSNLFTAADGTDYAPNIYTIQVHPNRIAYWQSDPDILQTVARYIDQAASEAGIHFLSLPVVHLVTNTTIPVQEFRIVPSISQDPISDTAAIPALESKSELGPETIPANAFLIVDGNQVFPLKQAVINIGRRLDNDLSIDDPRISRKHAQLRSIHGQFVLFDLNSTGGSYVNGQRVTRYHLNPGDVISLAGVPLIFGQDITSQNAVAKNSDQKVPDGSTQSIPNTVTEINPKKHDT